MAEQALGIHMVELKDAPVMISQLPVPETGATVVLQGCLELLDPGHKCWAAALHN